jgi:hypothetical protein
MAYVISADILHRMMVFASTDPTRYYLNGLQIEPIADGGAIIVATDGSRLGVWRDSDAIVPRNAKPVILSNAKPIINALKGKSSRHLYASIDPIGKGRLTIFEARTILDVVSDNPKERLEVASVPNVLVDGTFPDWRRVFPVNVLAAGPATPFCARLLADFGKAADDPKHATIIAHPNAVAGGPAVVTVNGRPEFRGVIMPKPGGKDIEPVPAWLSLPAPAATDQEAA